MRIISLRTQIMNFKELEHEHVAQSWERMKLMLSVGGKQHLWDHKNPYYGCRAAGL